jgi:hypothetical protein
VRRLARVVVVKRQELPFVRASLRELAGRVDEVFLSIPTVSHSGLELERDFSESEIVSGISMQGTKLTLHEIEGTGFVRNATNSHELHYNEFLTRVAFTRQANVGKSDLILALDADEVPFGDEIESVMRRALPRLMPVRLKFRQFFYRPNFLWEDYIFRSPVISSVLFGQMRLFGFRDKGVTVSQRIHGCHFSWNLSPEEMVSKLQNYSHALDYKHLASEDVLGVALASRTYPFDPGMAFSLRELEWPEFIECVPRGLISELPSIHYLLPEAFLRSEQ